MNNNKDREQKKKHNNKTKEAIKMVENLIIREF